MDNTLVPYLERIFRCHIHGVKPQRKVWLAKSDRGLWIVKGYSQREKAEWVTRLSAMLHEKGFYHTVQYLGNDAGEQVFPINGHYYTVMKAIIAREANNASLYDVKRSAATLARFHQAAKGFPAVVTLAGYKPPLLEKWEGRLEEFNRIASKIAKRGPQNRLEQIVLGLAGQVRKDAEQALERSYMMPLAAEMQQAAIKGTLAHHDVASHNFLITKGGSCYLIDLDTVGSDMQLADLVQFFGRMLLLQGYSLYAFHEAIDAYNKIKPLRETQIWMIHQLLRYPDNILREVTGLYAKRPGYRVRNVQQLLLLERRYQEERERFLSAEEQILQRTPWGAYHYVG
jgi:CotS family spore coat protein